MIPATSLRTNSNYKTQQAPSFGKAEHKNHRARNIAIAVGTAGAVAAGAYVFRGQIARLGFVKDVIGLAMKGFGKVIDFGIAVRDFFTKGNFSEKIKNLSTTLRTKLNPKKTFEVVNNNTKKVTTVVKDTAVKVSEKVKVVKSTVEKAVPEKVSKNIKDSEKTIQKVKENFMEKLSKVSEDIKKQRTRAQLETVLTDLSNSAKETIEKIKSIRKR